MQEMHKKYMWITVAFVVLLGLFFVISGLFSREKVEAPQGITNEVEQRVFYGPTGAPYVEGPNELAPRRY